MNRQSLRFSPDPNTLVYIKRLASESAQGTDIDCIGIVHTEAGKGFGAILLKGSAPKPGEKCLVKVGELAPLQARLAYAQELGTHAVECGFEYLD